MSVDLRVYDNEHGDPVVVMVTTGTFDVSRLIGVMRKGRCEDQAAVEAIAAGLRRHNGGRSALKLLAEHGGPNLLERVTEQAAPAPSESERFQVEEARRMLAELGAGRLADPRIYGTERTLYDHARHLLDLIDKLAPKGDDHA